MSLFFFSHSSKRRLVTISTVKVSFETNYFSFFFFIMRIFMRSTGVDVRLLFSRSRFEISRECRNSGWKEAYSYHLWQKKNLPRLKKKHCCRGGAAAFSNRATNLTLIFFKRVAWTHGDVTNIRVCSSVCLEAVVFPRWWFFCKIVVVPSGLFTSTYFFVCFQGQSVWNIIIKTCRS